MRRLLLPLALLGALCALTAFGGHRASRSSRTLLQGPVDIAALAREESKDSAAAPAGIPAAKQNQSWLLSAGLILMAAAGTTLTVALIHRRALRAAARADLPGLEPASPRNTPACVEPAQGPAGHAGETTDTFGESTQSGDPAEPGMESLDERTAALAERMQRGRGEMDLALRLEGRTDENAGTTLQRLTTGVTSNTQRVRTAKRFGVGRGEVDLAVRLKTLASHAREKEPTP